MFYPLDIGWASLTSTKSMVTVTLSLVGEGGTVPLLYGVLAWQLSVIATT